MRPKPKNDRAINKPRRKRKKSGHPGTNAQAERQITKIAEESKEVLETLANK
jgi:hypothetical protein